MAKPRKIFLCLVLLTVITGLIFAVKEYQFQLRQKKYDELILAASRRHSVPATLIKAVIRQESKFYEGVRGSHGEYGLMQITEAAADDWIKEERQKKFSQYNQLFSPELNIEIGTWYLSKGLSKYSDYKHKTALALARYNAGPGNVIKNKWVPSHKDGDVLTLINFPTTKAYIQNILKYEKQYAAKGFGI